MSRLLHLLCALVLCLQLCGGHLGMMQMVAWGSMLVSYSQTDGVVEATRKTFDGTHPCSLCEVITKTRDLEQENRGGPKAPAPDWSKFGKELAFSGDCQPPVRLDGDVHWHPAWAPVRLNSADPPSPPSPPPRCA